MELPAVGWLVGLILVIIPSDSTRLVPFNDKETACREAGLQIRGLLVQVNPKDVTAAIIRAV
jgi:hypothetical protein